MRCPISLALVFITAAPSTSTATLGEHSAATERSGSPRATEPGFGMEPRYELQEVTPQDLQRAIGNLGSLDYPVRTEAARVVRRASAARAVPVLLQAATEHKDGYVRYRALVLLSGFNDPRTKQVMEGLLSDPNDRLRTVVYNYYEYHPDPSIGQQLLAALAKEESEFVRPALVRALAALGSDPKIRESLLVDVGRGMDYFRSAVIEALGDYPASYATPALLRIAGQDGPLQDDAVIALGKIGDKRALQTLAALQRSAPRSAQPSIAAAICLLGVNCSSHLTYLDETLRFAAQNPGFQDLMRAAASGLAAIASRGNVQALTTLFDVGLHSTDPARAPIALAVGTVAVRNPELLVGYLEKQQSIAGALDLLAEAFDMLEEDYEEERFFVQVRKMYWAASENSQPRIVGQALIEKLEF